MGYWKMGSKLLCFIVKEMHMAERLIWIFWESFIENFRDFHKNILAQSILSYKNVPFFKRSIILPKIDWYHLSVCYFSTRVHTLASSVSHVTSEPNLPPPLTDRVDSPWAEEALKIEISRNIFICNTTQ